MRPSPTSLYGLIIQAPLTSHLIASYIRAGVFGCLKVDLRSSPHIPVEVPAYPQSTSSWFLAQRSLNSPHPEEESWIQISERQPNNQTIHEFYEQHPSDDIGL
ncbi:hypothetical protein Bpfe_014922 [Biomphalaria pfeifferi]|uniref:Uncharacterized protein n=1 Tax=Biomphalaria pfeifferi TaxID=112525 RepID=A0AAD8BJB5_BIOPF|nr:hypothetical protein Bpfe_014922 [Biomphalaria pfeifferi]